MGSYNSDDHIAEYHIHTNITICNIAEPQQTYRDGTVSNSLLGGRGGLKHALLDPKVGGKTFRN